MNDLVKNMINYRARHRISMRAFAEKCGVSLQTIYSIENGLQTPSRVTEAKINLVLEGDADETEHKQD